MSHSLPHGDTIPLHPSSAQSDMDEIESLIHAAPSSAAVLPARAPSPPRASIPISNSPALPPPTSSKPQQFPQFSAPSSSSPPLPSASVSIPITADGFGPPPNTLTEPVWDTVKRDFSRIVSNLKLVVFPNPFREDPGKALRDWDLWATLIAAGGNHKFLIKDQMYVFVTLKSEVFAVAFAVLAAGAIILTLNVLLLGRQIIFFQSLSLLGYCLFPLDVGALICLLNGNVAVKIVVVAVTLAWSSWAAYPFMSAAVNPRRKALALYPVLLMYVSVGFLVIAIN